MLILCYLVVFLLWWVWSYRRYLQLYWKIDSKYVALPFIGHGYVLLGDKCQALKRLFTLGEHAISNGGLSAIWCLHRLYIVVADGKDAEYILKNHLEKDDLSSVIRLIFRTSHIYAPVPVWRPRRKTISSLLSLKNVNKFQPSFAKHSETLVQQLRPLASKEAFSIWEHFNAQAVDNTCTTIIGQSSNSQINLKDPLRTAIQTLMEIAAEMITNLACYVEFTAKWTNIYKRLLKQDQVVRNFVEQALQKHEKAVIHESDTVGTAEQQQSSLLHMLMHLQKQCVDRSVLHDEALGLLIGASDTTAVSASLVSVMLARHPDIQEKVYQEISEVLGGSNRTVTIEDLPHLKYMEAVIKETQRLYPPIPHIARRALVDSILPSGVKVPKGVNFQISLYALNRNPKYWGADADQFRPDRFLDGSVPEQTTSFAFSYGPRGCLGVHYATMSLKTTMANLLRQYRLLPAAGDAPLRLLFGLTMLEADGYQVRIQARNTNI